MVEDDDEDEPHTNGVKVYGWTEVAGSATARRKV
jgi:hypothetical protein